MQRGLCTCCIRSPAAGHVGAAGGAHLSYLSFSASRRSTKSTGSLMRSGSCTSWRPVSRKWLPIVLRTSSAPPSTRLQRGCRVRSRSIA